MQTRAAAQFFFFFIRHKEGDGGFGNWEESSFDNTWHAGFLWLPPVPAGLLQFALLSRVEMKNDRPRKRPASKTALSLYCPLHERATYL